MTARDDAREWLAMGFIGGDEKPEAAPHHLLADLLAEHEALLARVEAAPVVTVEQMGDDEDGNPRVLASATRDELRKAGNIMFQTVRLLRVG